MTVFQCMCLRWHRIRHVFFIWIISFCNCSQHKLVHFITTASVKATTKTLPRNLHFRSLVCLISCRACMFVEKSRTLLKASPSAVHVVSLMTDRAWCTYPIFLKYVRPYFAVQWHSWNIFCMQCILPVAFPSAISHGHPSQYAFEECVLPCRLTMTQLLSYCC